MTQKTKALYNQGLWGGMAGHLIISEIWISLVVLK